MREVAERTTRVTLLEGKTLNEENNSSGLRVLNT